MASVYFPEMECDLIKGQWYTADEPSMLTGDDGTKYPFDLPKTAVHGRWPIQEVDACQGTGKGVILDLPAEPVVGGVAMEVPVTGSLNGRAFTGTLPEAYPVWIGFRKVKISAVTMEVQFTQTKGASAMAIRPDDAYYWMRAICDGLGPKAMRGRERLLLSMQQAVSPATWQTYGSELFETTCGQLRKTCVVDMGNAMSGLCAKGMYVGSTESATVISAVAQKIVATMGITPGPILQELLAALQQVLSTLLPALLACIPAG